MIQIVHYIAGTLAIVLWFPILWRFRQQWIDRKNPVSLAIAGHIFFSMLLAVTPFWLTHGVSAETLMSGNEILGLIVALAYYWTFWIAARRFKGTRGPR